jgi:hypothetical protein
MWSILEELAVYFGNHTYKLEFAGNMIKAFQSIKRTPQIMPESITRLLNVVRP